MQVCRGRDQRKAIERQAVQAVVSQGSKTSETQDPQTERPVSERTNGPVVQCRYALDGVRTFRTPRVRLRSLTVSRMRFK
jgi:hypothetical protein